MGIKISFGEQINHYETATYGFHIVRTIIVTDIKWSTTTKKDAAICNNILCVGKFTTAALKKKKKGV